MEQNNKYLLSICIPTLNRSTYLQGLLTNISYEITKYNLSNDLQIVILTKQSFDKATNKLRQGNRDELFGLGSYIDQIKEVKPIVIIFFSLAVSKALIIFLLLPLVLNPTITSPSFPMPSTILL